MKFAAVTFAEDYELNTMGEVYSFEAGKTYGFPMPKARQLEYGDAPVERLADVGDVAEEDVHDRFGEEMDADEEAESPSEWLEARTVDDVHDEMGEFVSIEADIGFLEAALDAADRKGAREAIENRLEELRG